MLGPRVREIVRQFPENSMKLLLENAGNLREVLALAGAEMIDAIDFARLKRRPTTFVQRDYRHVESDVVLTAPLRGRRGGGQILIYILIEHQSEPDVLMPLRLVDYVVQIYKAQLREQARRSTSAPRLHPVLPLVFYTGTQRWDSVGRLVDLVVLGDHFAPRVPALEPLFLNLRDTEPEQLETAGGYFGWVLRLVQERKARPADFRQLLERVVDQLETMPLVERSRWLELLSYIHAMVYHEREPPEHARLHDTIAGSVHAGQRKQEVSEMRKTIADVLKEEGRKEGRKEGILQARRQVLLELLQYRFAEVPAEVVQTVKATRSAEQVDNWLKRFANATSLEEVGISPAR